MINGNFRQNPNTKEQRSNISCREVELIRRPQKVDETPLASWLRDLNFDMLDQRYELGKKTLSYLDSTNAAIRRWSYSWLHDRDEDDLRETHPGYISTPLLCLARYIETIQLRPSDTMMELPVAPGGRIGPLERP